MLLEDDTEKAETTLTYKQRVPIYMEIEKMLYDNVFYVPYWDIPAGYFRADYIKWDPSVRKDAWYAWGTNQYHWEYGWRSNIAVGI
ncbi:hypothetical protein ACFLXD_03260 [Chloroflexota bacterium]